MGLVRPFEKILFFAFPPHCRFMGRFEKKKPVPQVVAKPPLPGPVVLAPDAEPPDAGAVVLGPVGPDPPPLERRGESGSGGGVQLGAHHYTSARGGGGLGWLEPCWLASRLLAAPPPQ